MRVNVVSLCFEGGYNSVYEQAWNHSFDYIDISEDEIVNKKISRILNRLCCSMA